MAELVRRQRQRFVPGYSAIVMGAFVPTRWKQTMMINGDLTVDEVMRHWPGVIEIFIRRRMLCVGCAIARFCTIREACVDHNIPLPDFLAELNTQSEMSDRSPHIPA